MTAHPIAAPAGSAHALHLPGVSVVICCYNSAQRLPETLAHLARQTADFDWEVIVVDNASTDDTAKVARECWKSQKVPLRVVPEPKPGLMHARLAGLAASRYEWISYVDDDNWLCPDWLDLVAEIFRSDPRIAACGGRAEPVFETPPPEWFERYAIWFALGPQGDASGHPPRGFLYGAGLNLRRSAFETILARGFHSLLVGRTGTSLTTSEDAEMGLVLGLAGWTLWYDERLTMRHFIPTRRLQWAYLRDLHRAVGEASIWLDAYRSFDGYRRTWWKIRVRRSWLWRFCRTARDYWRVRGRLPAPDAVDGSDAALDAVLLRGKFRALLRTAFTYDLAVQAVESAPWRRRLAP